MSDNRILLKLFKYWRSKIAGRSVPSRADIKPRELRDLLPFLFLAGVRPLGKHGSEIDMRLTGTHVERSIAFDPTGCVISGSGIRWKDFILSRDFFEAAAKRLVILAAHELRIEPAHEQPAALLRYTRLILPLSADGARINMLLGGLVAHVSKNPMALWQGKYDFVEIGKWRLSDPFKWPIEAPL